MQLGILVEKKMWTEVFKKWTFNMFNENHEPLIWFYIVYITKDVLVFTRNAQISDKDTNWVQKSQLYTVNNGTLKLFFIIIFNPTNCMFMHNYCTKTTTPNSSSHIHNTFTDTLKKSYIKVNWITNRVWWSCWLNCDWPSSEINFSSKCSVSATFQVSLPLKASLSSAP